MVKYVVSPLVLSLAFILPTICLGAQSDSYRVLGVFRSSEIKERVHILDIYYEKKDNKEICSAILKLKDNSWQTKIDNFSEDHVRIIQEEQRLLKQPEKIYLALRHGAVCELNLLVNSVNHIYGSEEYHSVSTCSLSTNGTSMKIRYRDGSGIQEVQLYQPENIKNIVGALNKGKGCIIKLTKQTNPDPLSIKVENYTSGGWIWWDGWMPKKSQIDGWPNMPHYEIAKKTAYNLVNINLDNDKNYEAIYTKNQLIGMWIKRLSLASGCFLLCYLLRDKITEIL